MFHEVFHDVRNAAFDLLRYRRCAGSVGQNDTLSGEFIEVFPDSYRDSNLNTKISISLRQARAPTDELWVKLGR